MTNDAIVAAIVLVIIVVVGVATIYRERRR